MPADKKTNAMRILEKLNIPYETASYDDDGEHELKKGAANMTAQKLGIDPDTVYKTIVMRNESKQIFVFCQSATNEINLKKARAVTGSKEIAPVKPEELMALTGYIRGGCSPLGMKKQFPTFIDENAQLYDKIHISAGVRGMQIIIAPDDLKRATSAEYCDLILEK